MKSESLEKLVFEIEERIKLHKKEIAKLEAKLEEDDLIFSLLKKSKEKAEKEIFVPLISSVAPCREDDYVFKIISEGCKQ